MYELSIEFESYAIPEKVDTIELWFETSEMSSSIGKFILPEPTGIRFFGLQGRLDEIYEEYKYEYGSMTTTLIRLVRLLADENSKGATTRHTGLREIAGSKRSL